MSGARPSDDRPSEPRQGAPSLSRLRRLPWLIFGLVILGAIVFLLVGANRPPDPYVEGGRARVEGFGQIAFRVDRMASAERCALLAQNDQQRSRGLMGRKDLAGYDGMLFVYDEDTTGTFYMLNTPLPLSIAWFDANGGFVSSTDMEPCLTGPDCPRYSAAAPYRYALEVPKGGLEALGVGPGSVISIGGECPEE